MMNDDDSDDEKLSAIKKEISVKKKVAIKRVASPPSITAVNTKRRLVSTEKHFEPVNCWWEVADYQPGKFKYLEHRGMMFTPPYVPNNIPVKYDSQSIVLPPSAEQIAGYWCSATTSDYATKDAFKKNFWTAFLSELHASQKNLSSGTSGCAAIVAGTGGTTTGVMDKYEDWVLEKLDVNDLKLFLDQQREGEKSKRKNFTREEREADKKLRQLSEGKYQYCLLDGVREKISTYKAEVPGLFRGRGLHPKMGRLKRRILPDDVTINCSADAPVPKVEGWLKGHSWLDTFHDNTVTWLSFYKDSVNAQFKYTFLAADSTSKGYKDYLKYEKARLLKSYIVGIRKDYESKMTLHDKQHHHLEGQGRRGNNNNNMMMIIKSHEVSDDDVYDQQLGLAAYLIDVLALRVGNEKDKEEEADTVGCCSLRVEHITEFNDDENSLTLDFLGKDSIRYLNTVCLKPLPYRILKEMVEGKNPHDNIFDKINTSLLNKYLSSLMPGLSAKVFRTYNASITLQDELSKLDPVSTDDDVSSVDSIKRFYENANRQVAILCNHQRSVPKQHDLAMVKLKVQLEETAKSIELVETYIKTGGKNYTYNNIIKSSIKQDQAQRKLEGLKNKQRTQELRMSMKDENKAVSNSTSKQHYMDPRITASFCKKFEIQIEKIFNSTLLRKFQWAMHAPIDFIW